MTFTELLPNLQKLNPSDKLRAIQFLATELSKIENFHPQIEYGQSAFFQFLFSNPSLFVFTHYL